MSSAISQAWVGYEDLNNHQKHELVEQARVACGWTMSTFYNKRRKPEWMSELEATWVQVKIAQFKAGVFTPAVPVLTTFKNQ